MREYRGQLIKALRGLDMDVYDAILILLYDVLSEGNGLFLIGNGGSSANASHITNDFVKLIPDKTGRDVQAHCLSDNVPLITALANDNDYEDIFAAQVRTFMSYGDALIAFSGSGNSPNIIKAVKVANDITSSVTIGLCGRGGGELAQEATRALIVPSESMQIIEDVHLAIAHSLCVDLIELFQ